MRSLAALGYPALTAAFVFAVMSTGLFAAAAAGRREDLASAGRRSLYATFGFVAVSALALVSALFAHDFSLSYVAGYTSRSLSGPYTLTALWGGMEGSLLLWALLLAGFGSLAVRTTPIPSVRVTSGAGTVLAGTAGFFLLLLLLPANPFAVQVPAPPDGSGLNPLLQSPGMLVHPPLLYTGFVGFSVPFAFAVSALVTKELDLAWFTSTRRWTLFSWSALSVGIVLGGAWAYSELGWGGYWAWDPVENASLLPWLAGTAYLHSVVVQERRRMLKVWNVSLISLAYVLALFGTFLTRSGILSSIHTFSEGPVGRWFLPFLAVVAAGASTLIALRAADLSPGARLDSPLSREASFIAQNLLLLAAVVVVLWGTVYPLVAEAITGTRVAVGPPFFEAVFTPLALALVALMGLGPLLSWRRTTPRALAAITRAPVLAAAAVFLSLWALGVRSMGAALAFSLCAFTGVSIAGEFVRGSRIYRRKGASWARALARTVMRNRRRYAGYIVHAGFLLVVIGIAGAAFNVERQAVLRPGGWMTAGPYRLHYTSYEEDATPEKLVDRLSVRVYRGGSYITTLHPQRNFHFAQQQPQSEVAVRTNPVEDLYVVATSFEAGGRAALRVFVNPLTWWIWAGGAVMAAGMAVLLTERSPARRTLAAATRQTTRPRAAVLSQ